MTKSERKFEKRKANLIMDLSDSKFYDYMYDELKTRAFNTLDDLDAFVDSKLKEHVEMQRKIRAYYDAKIGPDDEVDEDSE